MFRLEHATPGTILLLLIIVGPVIYFIRKAQQGADLHIRRIRAIDAIDEATGRAAELGRPIVFSTGLTSVGPLLYACLGILYYVARKAANYATRIIAPQNDPQVLAIVEDTIRDGFRDEDRLSSFEPRDIQFLSEDQFAFAAGYMGLVQRENAASTFLLGRFAAESLLLAEAGQQVGAMQIAGSVNFEQVPFFICTCDYTAIGEELFASSAYLTREPIQVGSVVGQDRGKLFLMGLMLIGVVTATYHSVVASRDPGSVPPEGTEQQIADYSKYWNIQKLFTAGWDELIGGESVEKVPQP